MILLVTDNALELIVSGSRPKLSRLGGRYTGLEVRLRSGRTEVGWFGSAGGTSFPRCAADELDAQGLVVAGVARTTILPVISWP